MADDKTLGSEITQNMYGRLYAEDVGANAVIMNDVIHQIYAKGVLLFLNSEMKYWPQSIKAQFVQAAMELLPPDKGMSNLSREQVDQLVLNYKMRVKYNLRASLPEEYTDTPGYDNLVESLCDHAMLAYYKSLGGWGMVLLKTDYKKLDETINETTTAIPVRGNGIGDKIKNKIGGLTR